MRTLCFYFQIHQPLRFRRYRFFDIGNEHYYYDDYLNESILRKVADRCYLPANKVMYDLIQKHKGKFKIAFSISGIALDQFEMYAPEVIDSFKELADTGCVEFLSETYAHSLVPLISKAEFEKQVYKHSEKIKELFNYEPKVFRMTELVYSDEIGSMVADMGYKAMLTEGAKHILGWKSPNYLYYNSLNPKLKILLRNFKLSDDIAFRFSNRSWSEYPLVAGKYMSWLKAIDKKEEAVNIFMDYETFGEHQWAETGIFDFLKALPGKVIKHTDLKFCTPSEVADLLQPVAPLQVPFPISWADEERDLTAWLGNELQKQAFNKLYELKEKVDPINDPVIKKDFENLQISDHFYYMSTKFFSDGEVHSYFNPFESPYDAFINYMNILSDFEIRVNALTSKPVDAEVSKLSLIISEKDELLERYEKEIAELKASARKKNIKGTNAPEEKKAGRSPGKTPASKKKSGKVTSKSATIEKKSGKVTSKSATIEKKSGKITAKSETAKKTVKPAVTVKPSSRTAVKKIIARQGTSVTKDGPDKQSAVKSKPEKKKSGDEKITRSGIKRQL